MNMIKTEWAHDFSNYIRYAATVAMNYTEKKH